MIKEPFSSFPSTIWLQKGISKLSSQKKWTNVSVHILCTKNWNNSDESSRVQTVGKSKRFVATTRIGAKNSWWRSATDRLPDWKQSADKCTCKHIFIVGQVVCIVVNFPLFPARYNSSLNYVSAEILLNLTANLYNLAPLRHTK